jgi:hypothetical protein
LKPSLAGFQSDVSVIVWNDPNPLAFAISVPTASEWNVEMFGLPPICPVNWNGG